MMHLLLILILFLTACGPPDSAPSGRTVATRARPPIKTPQIHPSTALNTPETEKILFDHRSLQTYTYAGSQRFSIDYPANWQVFEQTDGVIFIDPDNQAGYGIFFSFFDQNAGALTAENLNVFARQFVQDNFGHEEDFGILAQEEGIIRFKETDANLGSAISELSFLKHDSFVYFVLITAVEDQWAQALDDLRGLTDSLVFHPVPTPTPTADLPPNWVLYGHPTQRFAFLYPDNWDLTEEARSVAVVLAAQQFVLSVDVVAVLGVGQETERVEAFTRLQLDKLATQFETFEALPLTPYQAGQATGYTADYLYQDETGLPIAGSIIVTGIDDKLYHISITAPAPLYEAALAWFNPMMQSFRVLPAE